jgi:predicted MFS family arabinose efflux permease
MQCKSVCALPRQVAPRALEQEKDWLMQDVGLSEERSSETGDAAGLNRSQRAGPRAWYTLAILTLIMAMNSVDRYVLAILVEPIKADLKLSDTQIGVLTGFAFSAFHALFSLPIATLSDRGLRYRVIWISMSVWAVMTALCGAAQSFFHLLLGRFLVGGGEAGASPACQSFLAEIFPPHQRNTALGLFFTGGGIGVALAFAIGGWLEQAVGWRLTFLFVALPCALLIAIFLLTVRDPRACRSNALAVTKPAEAEPLSSLWTNKMFVHLCLGVGYTTFLMLGLPQWYPAFLERSHHVARADAGAMLAVSASLGMIAGIVVGGVVADRIRRRDPTAPLKLTRLSTAFATVPLALAFALDQVKLVIFLLGVGAFAISLSVGIISATTQSIVRPTQRASAAAAAIIVMAFVGLGLLPLLVGISSDLLSSRYGPDGLRWAIFTMICLTLAPMFWHFSRVLTFAKRRQSEEDG